MRFILPISHENYRILRVHYTFVNISLLRIRNRQDTKLFVKNEDEYTIKLYVSSFEIVGLVQNTSNIR